ncbi:MAG TPA: stage V sporulation protein AA [Cerasibacillus sp.]|uniref:stage V sporulation protein AA n=1 Tax=Cerasibacillus sp. TaxID=2498711 RepID=UPI002F419FD0
MNNTVYVRMKQKINVRKGTSLTLNKLADVSTSTPLSEEINQFVVYQLSDNEKHVIVFDQFFILEQLQKKYPEIDVHFLGANQTIVQISNKQSPPSILLAVIVWFILFIGTAMTIMNFHYDVSMQETQQKIHYMLTGKAVQSPLWIQIPYSLGLGVGMLLFFNHWFKKRFNNEPSPLEIEISKYQDSLDDYIKKHEKHVD